MTILEFGKLVTGWSSVNIFQVMVRGDSGETFEALRERLEAEVEEIAEGTELEMEAVHSPERLGR